MALNATGLSQQSLDDVPAYKTMNGSEAISDPKVISRQATINVGTIGHVAHGKSTVVKALSTINTVKSKNEIERNLTIKLGYANAKMYECPNCRGPERFHSGGSGTPDDLKCTKCGVTMNLRRHVSFVDCPGHDILMATMLNGAAVMDAALLLIAGNEPCPQPQTSEHLAAVEIMQLQNIIILQNKIDLIKETTAKAQFDDIQSFIRGTVAEGAPVIPISAQLQRNIDCVIEHICTLIPVPERNLTLPPRLIVIRSFDINLPGTSPRELQGGIAGGSLLQGVLCVGDRIEVRPGVLQKAEGDTEYTCSPVRSTIVSMHAEKNQLMYAVPGGLVGIGTKIDPALCRGDRLVGQVVGHSGQLPDIFSSLVIDYFLLSNLLGVHADASRESSTSIAALKHNETLLVNIGSTSTNASVSLPKDGDSGRDQANIKLLNPVCSEIGEKVALSRRIDGRWRLIGWGQVISGKQAKVNHRYL